MKKFQQIKNKLSFFLLFNEAGRVLSSQYRVTMIFVAKWWWVPCALIAWKFVVTFLAWLYRW